MFKHVNVSRERESITNKFSEALDLLQQNKNFFDVVNILGCYTSALYKGFYSATDCCNAVETIEFIFKVPKTLKFDHVNHDELKHAFELNGNYLYNLKIMGKNIPFHTFILIKYDNEWYLIQSFFGICTLNVKKDSEIYLKLLNFMKNPTTIVFDSLFGTNLPNKQITDLGFILSYYPFDELPIERLKLLLKNFIEK